MRPTLCYSPKAVVKQLIRYLLHSMFRKLALFGAPTTFYASLDVRSINHDSKIVYLLLET